MEVHEIFKRAIDDAKEHGKIQDWIKDVPSDKLIACIAYMEFCNILGIDPVYDNESSE